MGKRSFKPAGILGRLVKIAMVVVLLPPAAALLLGILHQLEIPSLSGGRAREWITWGAMTYLGIHVLLYRPVALFRGSHRLFSTLAVWLFGGQVASTEGAKVTAAKKKWIRHVKADGEGQGSTLVALSPYVIPLYTVLVCAAGWGAGQWVDRAFLDGPVAFFVGVTMAFHWLMTADDLQPQRETWHVETYLLAIGLIFVITLLIASACLPWAIPEFSFVHALAGGLARTHTFYTTIIQRLFL